MRELPAFLQLLTERRYAIIEAVQFACLAGALGLLVFMAADVGLSRQERAYQAEARI